MKDLLDEFCARHDLPYDHPTSLSVARQLIAYWSEGYQSYDQLSGRLARYLEAAGIVPSE